MDEEIPTGEMKEILNLMEKGINLTIIFQIHKIFRGEFQVEITIMHQN